MTRLDDLRKAQTLPDLAAILGVTASGLAYILYHKPRDQLYRTFQIPKRKGGSRTIHAPTDELKVIQKKLSLLLTECWSEIGQDRKAGSRYPGRKNRISHGFLPGLSIRTNARQHRRKRFVFNLDLEDFFGTINFGRVYGFFQKDKNFLLQPKIAATIAAIACFDNKLPQGSPCSPIISNFVARILDARIVGYASSLKVCYTRYADDLTFSSNHRKVPPGIACENDGAAHSWKVGTKLASIIRKSGFRINPNKTRVQYSGSRQDVTGLVVNRRINVPVEYRRRVRAMSHKLFTTGSFDLPVTILKTDGSSEFTTVEGKMPQLHGMMSFVASLDRAHREAAAARGESMEETSIERLYRSFLYYRFFFRSEKPVILCEGITDNIYLRCAIRALRAYYDLLVRPKADADDLLVKFYKYRGAGTDAALSLKDGGTGNLKNFIGGYRKAIEQFSGPGSEMPVIIVVDNDDAGRKVMRQACEIAGQRFDVSQEHVHVYRNLYVVSTHPKPLPPGTPTKNAYQLSESCIEEYFSDEIRGQKLDGKTLNLQNTSSGIAHYGKMAFAKQIVERLSDPEDFSGFRPLLDRLNAVIKAHNASDQSALPEALSPTSPASTSQQIQAEVMEQSV
ncbi:retron Ec67 family RNA-directed DNA polymerase/endonuclease [Achromobacter animicus]